MVPRESRNPRAMPGGAQNGIRSLAGLGTAVRVLVLGDGASIHTERWILGLTKVCRYDVYLINMNPAGVRPGIHSLLPSGHIETLAPSKVNPAGGNWRYLLKLGGIRSAVRRIAPDVIVAIYLTSHGLLGALAKNNALLVQAIIGSDLMVMPFRNRVYRWLASFSLHRTDLIVCASETLHRRLLTIFQPRHRPVIVQQYGIEDWIQPPDRRESRYTFVSNRAWIRNSNIPFLLSVFRRLQGPLRLALIGSDGDQRGQILDAAARDDRVELLGNLSHDENVAVVGRSDIFLSLTTSDGASLSLMEAMAVGAIPIVSDIAPNREWVRDGVNGFVVSLSDPDQALDRFQRALALSDAERRRIRAENLRIIDERGRLSVNMKRFSKAVLNLVGGGQVGCS